MENWFTADTHYHQKNIVRGTTTWTGTRAQNVRDFNTIEEMDEALIKAINDNVKEGDTLYHLGDVAFGGIGRLFEFRRRLRVKELHLVLGNHDDNIRENKQNCQLLFTTIQEYLPIKIHGQRIIMSHYAMRTWDKGHKGSWMLHGHSHGSLGFYGNGHELYKTLDVGVDCNDYYEPFSFEQLRWLMEKRVNLSVDHHQSAEE